MFQFATLQLHFYLDADILDQDGVERMSSAVGLGLTNLYTVFFGGGGGGGRWGERGAEEKVRI